MNFLYKLEKKFGRHAINNLSAYVVGSWAIGYLLWAFLPKVYELLIFDVAYVFGAHQFWRVFTWGFTMPGPIDMFSILMIFIYFSIGTSIEKHVGTFVYNLYIFGSYFFITLGMLVQGAITYLNDTATYDLAAVGLQNGLNYGSGLLEIMSQYGPTYFISMSVFLGFALIYSESTMLLFFVFPIKTKWLAYADVIYMVYMLMRYGSYSLLAGIIIAVLFNFYLFYLISKNYSSRRRSWRNGTDTLKRQKVFKKKMEQAQAEQITPKGVARHKCSICGKTENDDENLEFRFCSRCNGNHEYCNEHLFTHEHIK